MRFFLALLLALLLPSAAHAEWFEASSTHFVVYADDSERDIRKFSEQLERYHEAMAVITQRTVIERIDAGTPPDARELAMILSGGSILSVVPLGANGEPGADAAD